MPRRLLDVFCNGSVEIEIIGANARLTWHVTHGDDHEPCLALVVPIERLDTIGRQFVAAAQLVPDEMGNPVGRA